MEEEEGEAQDSTSGHGGFKHQTATMDIRVIKIVNYKTIYIIIYIYNYIYISSLSFVCDPPFDFCSYPMIVVDFLALGFHQSYIPALIFCT